jgi:hypothetical protein
MKLLEATRTAKKLIAAITAVVPSLTVEDAVRLGVEEGVLFEDDEEYKLRVAGDWREALKILYKRLGEGGG